MHDGRQDVGVRKLGIGLVSAAAVYGCASTVTPFDIGGSKADGTIIIGANLGLFNAIESVDWTAAAAMARQRCAAWGYKGGAQGFTGYRSQCVDADCFQKEISRTYQCLD